MGHAYRIRLETTAQSCAVTRSTSKLAKRSDSVSAISPIALWTELKCSVVLAARVPYTRCKSTMDDGVVAHPWIFQKKFSRGILLPFNYRWIFQYTARHADHLIFRRLPATYVIQLLTSFFKVYSRHVALGYYFKTYLHIIQRIVSYNIPGEYDGFVKESWQE